MEQRLDRTRSSAISQRFLARCAVALLFSLCYCDVVARARQRGIEGDNQRRTAHGVGHLVKATMLADRLGRNPGGHSLSDVSEP